MWLLLGASRSHERDKKICLEVSQFVKQNITKLAYEVPSVNKSKRGSVFDLLFYVFLAIPFGYFLILSVEVGDIYLTIVMLLPFLTLIACGVDEYRRDRSPKHPLIEKKEILEICVSEFCDRLRDYQVCGEVVSALQMIEKIVPNK